MRQFKISKSITSRESKSVEKYFQEVSKLELISPEEEAHLAILIKQGDGKAFDRLIKANLRFVVSVAKQYQNQGLPLPDLINEGNIGLIKAARNFDPTRGFKFISYAIWSIRRQMAQAILENASMIRLPLNKAALKGRIKMAGLKLEQKLERTVSVEELAEELNMAEKDITATLSMNEKLISLDSPLIEEGEDSMIDVLENPNAEHTDKSMNYTASLCVEIDRSLQTLNEKQKEVICCLFGIGLDQPMSLEDIARKNYVTAQRIKQIKDKAMIKLRACGNFNLLRSFLCT